MQIFSKSLMIGLLLGLVTFTAIITIRLPFLNKPLTGEEGTHAMLLIQNISQNSLILGNPEKQSLNSCLTLIGHIDGKDVYVRPSRNLMPYCIINKVIGPLVLPFYAKAQSFEDKTILARGVFLLISALGYFALCVICIIASLHMRGFLKILPFAVLFYASSTVLSVGSSIQPQLDGSIGLFLLCISFLLVVFSSLFNLKNKITYALLFFAGFLSAFCKNEWPIALGVSILTIFIIIIIFLRLNIRNTFILIEENYKNQLIFLLSGIGLGIVTCITLSPNDYFYGYRLMNAIGSQKYSPIKLIGLFQDLLKPLVILIVIAAFISLLNVKNLLGKSLCLSVYFIFSIGVIIGFVQSGWLGDSFPRYFAPPLLLIASYGAASLAQVSDRQKIIASICCLPFLIWGIYQNLKILKVYNQSSISITVPGDTNWITNDILGAEKNSRENPDKVFITHSSVRYYFPETQFVSRDYGESGAKEILKILNRTDLVLVNH